MSRQLTNFKILPAIDLIENRMVRLKQGLFSEIVHYSQDPLNLAQDFERDGAQYIHLVDLDGARSGEPRQQELIRKIVQETGLKVQVGGGLRHAGAIEEYIRMGVDRVVIGSLAVLNPELTRSIIKQIGASRITLAFDFKRDASGQLRPAIDAWTRMSEYDLAELFGEYDEFSELEYLCTDISRDGCLLGIDSGFYEILSRAAPMAKLIVSGGVSTLEDVQLAKDLELHGLILGKALHEGRMRLPEVLQC